MSRSATPCKKPIYLPETEISCSPFHYNPAKIRSNLKRKPNKSNIKTTFSNPPRIVQNMIYKNDYGFKTVIIDGLCLETWIKMIVNQIESYQYAMQGVLTKQRYLGFNLENTLAANLRVCQDLFRDKLDVLWSYMLQSSMTTTYINHVNNSIMFFMKYYGSWAYAKDVKLEQPVQQYFDDKGVITESKVIGTTESLKTSFPVYAATMFCIAATLSQKMHIRTMRLFLDLTYDHFQKLALEISQKYDS